MSRKAYVDSAN